MSCSAGEEMKSCGDQLGAGAAARKMSKKCIGCQWQAEPVHLPLTTSITPKLLCWKATSCCFSCCRQASPGRALVWVKGLVPCGGGLEGAKPPPGTGWLAEREGESLRHSP